MTPRRGGGLIISTRIAALTLTLQGLLWWQNGAEAAACYGMFWLGGTLVVWAFFEAMHRRRRGSGTEAR